MSERERSVEHAGAPARAGASARPPPKRSRLGFAQAGGLLWPQRTVRTQLPDRVRTRIREQQEATERLIGWVQLAVVLIFAALYALAPKPFAEEQDFQPVPWALAAYFAFTVVRLGLAYRLHLPDWFLYLSIVIDMTLLYVLIWSFHLQYEQPASFYLKAPTLLYAFIFIALRALRFEARFVLAAGVIAAVGWFVLVLYAIGVDPRNDMITRNYIEYITSNSVLLGAEFDKMISILMVTVILAVAIMRARALLVRSVAEGAAAEDLARFFAPEVAQRIVESEQPVAVGAGELRQAAILNLDLRGFTPIAEAHPPDQVMGLLADYQATMVPVVRKHGGSIDKFLGDGIMCTFGAAEEGEAYAAAALECVDEIVQTAVAWERRLRERGSPAPPVNAAVAAGRVLFGAVGEKARLEYTVIGEAVNLAAKLEKHNAAAGTRALATAEAYELARAQGYRPAEEPRRLAEAQVAGLGHPVDVVVLAE